MWWIYDANWQCPFRSAPLLRDYLMGKHKPIYFRGSDVGDHVVVINTAEIAMKNEMWREWKYFHHTGYAGGFSATRAWKVHDADPTKVLEKAVYACTKGSLLRRRMMPRLHLFPDENVPDDILKNITGQIQQVLPIPKRLDQYPPKIREEFPKLFDWPEDHVITMGQKNVKE